MTPDDVLACCRFAHGASAMVLWGTFGYLAFLVPNELGRKIGARIMVMRIVATLVAVATTLLFLPIEAATVGGGWPDAIHPETLRAVLFETDLGWAWAARCLAAVALASACFLPQTKRTVGTALAAGLLLAMVALQGHAAMQEGWIGAGHRLNDAVHVLAGGAWLGALLPLLPILAALDRPEARVEASVPLRRFSNAGHVAVALVVATGVVNTALVLGRWPTDWSSPYQALLSLKILAVAVMIGLAVVNRYILVPRLRHRREPNLKALRAATLTEVAFGLAAVACVAAFGLMEPS